MVLFFPPNCDHVIFKLPNNENSGWHFTPNHLDTSSTKLPLTMLHVWSIMNHKQLGDSKESNKDEPDIFWPHYMVNDRSQAHLRVV